jgi:hypothetical protein
MYFLRRRGGSPVGLDGQRNLRARLRHRDVTFAPRLSKSTLYVDGYTLSFVVLAVLYACLQGGHTSRDV